MKKTLFLQRKIFVIVFYLLLGSWVTAQETLITGLVKDDGNEPLPGVSVVIKGTTTGTITDFDGNYMC